MLTRAEVGVHINVLSLLATIVQEDRITVGDGAADLSSFTQTTGLTTSPVLFSILLKSLFD